MKLLRVGAIGQERPAILDKDQQIRDLSSVVPDINGDLLSNQALERLRAVDLDSLPIIDSSERVGPCIGEVGKIVCIGLNYSDHAAEAGMELPSEPVLFMKATSAISGPNDPIQIPRGADKTDWEVELAIVIGKKTKYISEDQSMDHIAGFCLANDLSERAFQLERLGSWDKGKSHDSFAPIGPYLVTKDEIVDPQNLRMFTEINGERFQDGNTNTMVFDVKTIVAYLSQFMTLEAGDVIMTGTPPGVGMGQSPQKYLMAGDRVRIGIEGLGEQHQLCIDA
ncbi:MULTISPECIES: fumarylacetoacetate hydrolase family protein [unclassified Marinobacterium]|jgi:2-keto-4-pentenoate hydratase/2-oxohepta-3-ene-1,7-dioic acid hydratase in catechol pathway|uniref:fumarylacetoacetate hydrolase family protein n=1 Tax=unclassified Marinobacterium TaxID=2644139 RepID=UPI00156A7253|nr:MULTISPECIES: fumarylacetoacetate hydrolase family protein [unclassified Marinobacterium]NRP14864.1 Ureidoglycolate lyase [Marinobacterium sp. xm-a-152]NRP27372.1 Ureidoglycolate lyase [Marinobacterium sp. xm-d-420]NRP36777.1 Ureidoglycolate lyase [Marinobacterium sp. xm-d-579]NRP46676.1 Ureidoglycolate lyase [Marinobacterium sp. xm-d-543]NRP52473.1 Ureidoglycolate lyase [Marinobacterium sp. xm-v-242]